MGDTRREVSDVAQGEQREIQEVGPSQPPFELFPFSQEAEIQEGKWLA